MTNNSPKDKWKISLWQTVLRMSVSANGVYDSEEDGRSTLG